MTRFRPWSLATAAAALLAALPLEAIDMPISVIQFPESSSVELKMTPTARVAPAEAEADVKFKNGQAAIEVEWKSLPPAVLFGGDVTSYVTWAVGRDGTAENLGELPVRKPKGDIKYSDGPEGVRADGHGRAPSPRPAAVGPRRLDQRRPARQEGAQHALHDELVLELREARQRADRRAHVVGHRSHRPRPGAAHPPAGAGDRRRAVQRGRDPRGDDRSRAGEQLVQGRQPDASAWTTRAAA